MDIPVPVFRYISKRRPTVQLRPTIGPVVGWLLYAYDIPHVLFQVPDIDVLQENHSGSVGGCAVAPD